MLRTWNFIKIQAFIGLCFCTLNASAAVDISGRPFCQGPNCIAVSSYPALDPQNIAPEIQKIADTKDKLYDVVIGHAQNMGIPISLSPADSWYAHNIAMLGSCSPYFNDELPRFDSYSTIPQTDTVAQDMEYLNEMWKLAREISSTIWGKKVPVKSMDDYVNLYFAPVMCCQPGTYNRVSFGFDNGTCSPCGKGYYCIGGSARAPCPMGTLTETNKAQSIAECMMCPEGSFCFDPGSIESCPAGTWSVSKDTLIDALDAFMKSKGYNPRRSEFMGMACAAQCPSGFTCAGDGKKTECPAGSYCPAGSSAPTLCPVGKWSLNGASAASDCAPNFCPEESYCEDGKIINCGAGFYYVKPADNSVARTFHNVCRPCNEQRQGDAGWNFYCPDGVGKVVCPAGHWAGATCEVSALADGDTYRNQVFITGKCPGKSEDCTKCAPGFICPNGGANIRECAEGYYCDGRDSFACPVGTWSAAGSVSFDGFAVAAKAAGATKASDCAACPAGNWCADGVQWPCPAGSICAGDGKITECPAGYYCPAGSSAPAVCEAGTWSLPGASLASDCKTAICAAGNWCENGVKSECPAGSFCAGNGTKIDCPAGSWCAAGVAKKTSCPDGTWSAIGSVKKADCIGALCGNNKWCEGTNAAIQECPAGFYCIISADDVVVKTECPEGKFCETGKGEENCPVGTWSLQGAKSAAECTNEICGIGNWCPGNGVRQTCSPGKFCAGNGILADCTAGKFCEAGSSVQRNCPQGRWSIAGESSCSVLECNADPIWAGKANWCADGSKIICPAGFVCSGDGTRVDCPAGHYCPEGSDAATTCPAGTWSYKNASAASDCKVALCGETELCAGGSKSPCAAGRYCPVDELSVICPAGAYCPENVRAPTPCAAGTWSEPGASGAASCTAELCGAGNWCENFAKDACTAGYYCPGIGRRVHCPEGHYCPAGSALSTYCPANTWSLAGAANAAACNATQCGVGNHCTDGTKSVCAAGYMCALGVNRVPCSGGYCPAGSSVATACPVGTYHNGAIGLVSADECAKCPAGKWGANCADNCPAGYVCADGKITTCGAGYYCAGGTAREQCPAGRYGESATASSAANCAVCPAGTWSAAGSTAKSQCAPNAVAPGYWTDGITGAIVDCGVGYYCPGDGTRRNCGAGNYCDGANLTAPKQCPAGTIGTGANLTTASGCTAASGSNYQSAPGQSTWLVCPAPFYVSAGGTQCVQCEDGFRCAGDGTRTACTGTTWAMSGSSVCYDCPTGFMCSGGIRTSCQPGTYSAGNSGVCATCTAGYYCPGAGDRIICPIGRWCPIAGLNMHIGCAVADADQGVNALNPAAGRYCPATGATSAELCPNGTWAEVVNEKFNAKGQLLSTGALSGNFMRSCPTCPVPSAAVTPSGWPISITHSAPFTDAVGSTANTQCKKSNLPCTGTNYYGNRTCNYKGSGSAYTDYDQSCGTCFVESCTAGARYVNNTTCTACAGGTYKDSHGNATACTNCAAGSASNDTGRTSACPACTGAGYQPNAGQTGCLTCGAGSFVSANRQSCSACPAGSYCSGNGTSQTCGSGQYQPSGGQSGCLTCPSGATCSSTGFSCPSGTEYNSSTNSCASSNCCVQQNIDNGYIIPQNTSSTCSSC
ncbi:MAG: hypothetical protein LBB23_01675, partial [Rickettsiales bacterium]|nr:hypothetical protein [Rickettsiales bacterium]